MASIIAFLKSLFQKLVALLSKKKGKEVMDYGNPFRKEESVFEDKFSQMLCRNP